MDVNLYCCYSLPLRNYLRDNGMRYKLCALNPNSKQRFWVYVKNEKLDNLLNKWSANLDKNTFVLENNYVQYYGRYYVKRKNKWNLLY